MLLLRSSRVIYGRAGRSVGGGFCIYIHTGARSVLSQYRIIYIMYSLSCKYCSIYKGLNVCKH